MAYLTRFTLAVQLPANADYTETRLIGELRSTYFAAENALEPDGSYNQRSSWYQHASEMASFSRNYPDALFCLYGVGNDGSDQWYKYFKNGKMQVCPAIITFEPYDVNKLE